MARTSVERKQKTAWPWVVGIGLLLLTLWVVTTLLAEDDDAGPEVTVATVQDTHPPAEIPAAPYADPVNATGGRSLQDLAPLDEADVGEEVQVHGRVVATGNQGFWILVGSQVLRVDSLRRVRTGDDVSLFATLQPAQAETTDAIVDSVLSRSPDSGEWGVIRELKLVEG